MKKVIKYVISILLIVVVILVLIMLIKFNTNIDNKLSNAEIDEVKQPDEKYTKIKEKYECNEFSYVNVSQEELVLIYFNKFRKNMLNYIEKSYNALDEEYRNKRFGNIEKYKLFVEDNYDQIAVSELNAYNVNEKEGYTQYVCIDKNGNYYIFNETAVMQYSVILDTYTLDMPEFVEKYNSTNEQGKCALNIQKFMQAIDAGDYGYAYNHLSETFKNNYFKTQSNFENYAKENFYVKNSAEYTGFENKTTVYTYKLNITNKEDESQKTSKTFVVKLNEGTGFELSFNM